MSLPLYIPNPVFSLISKEYYKGTDGHRLKQLLFSCHHHNVYGEKNPGTESVPLNKKAQTFLERLQGCQRTRTLVPCNSGSRFSTVTRKLLTLAGITCDIPGPNTEEVQGNHETDQRNRRQPHNNTGVHRQSLQAGERPRTRRPDVRSRRGQPCLCKIPHDR